MRPSYCRSVLPKAKMHFQLHLLEAKREYVLVAHIPLKLNKHSLSSYIYKYSYEYKYQPVNYRY